ncbi:MAG: dehydratase [Eubacterium sp.]|jgi:3-hydroxybutyryl-CoA dehydratase|nr:dehydratase [Eubacterium sp.]
MKSYTFHDIEQGMEEQFTVCVTEEKMDQFRAVTLDTNPLHRDPDYARANGYEDKVVFGMLTTSFISTLCGVWLPGENSLIYDLNASFIEPVYVGDELSVSGRVVEKSDALQMITIKWSINNQLEACVARGKVRVRVRK